MTLDQTLAARRSIRSFDATRTVSDQELRQMVAAAIEAPSWKNSQTARYHIARSAEAMQAVVAAMPDFNQKSVASAQALIVATFKHNRAGFERTGEPTNELGNGWGCYDLGLHNALLLLKAADLGLDTLVLGIRDAEQLRQSLAIPDDETVVSIIAVGHRTDDAARPKRKEVDDIARFL